MKSWLKGGLTGFVIGLVLSIILIVFSSIPVYITKTGGEGAGYLFIGVLFLSPVFILALSIICSLLFLIVEQIRRGEFSLIKIGFWIGLTLGVIVLFLMIISMNINYSRGEDYLYWLVAVFLSFIICIVTGFLAQKIKEKDKNWESWSYFKKSLIIGIILGIILSSLVVLYLIYFSIEATIQYNFYKMLEIISREILVTLILIISPLIFLPIIVLIIGWIFKKLFLQENKKFEN